MFSKTKMNDYNGVLINTHTYYSYEAIDNIKHVQFNRNDMGKCFQNNECNYRYSCFDGKSAGHIPFCMNGDNTTILVNTGEEINKEINRNTSFNSNCFIAHYQFKNSQDWLLKCSRQAVSSKLINLRKIKHVYDMVYDSSDMFIPCNILKEKWNNYITYINHHSF